MTSTQVLFATSRVKTADGAIPTFGTSATAPPALVCGTATVDQIDLLSPNAGVIHAISAANTGGFLPQDLQPVLDSGNDILVFVHGCANAFTDAITRAAYNKTWLAAANLPVGSSNFDVIAFSWPARSYFFANIIGDCEDYKADQVQAIASAAQFGLFMGEIYKLQQTISLQSKRRRINLLCHSMGNYVLAHAVDAWFKATPVSPTPFFDQVVLAAADETATTFNATFNAAGRLCKLSELGRQITVYYNNDDIAMALSHVVNQDYRLGYDGPPNAADMAAFPRTIYDFVDCTGVDDFINTQLEAPDRSHQYYRASPTVRADIAAILAGFTPTRPHYDPAANVYSLFPKS
jgi:esterase/lipase superfamily enzyme